MKQCITCEKSLPEDSFEQTRNACKKCVGKYKKEWASQPHNKEKRRISSKIYRDNNRDKIRAYYLKRKDKQREYQPVYYLNNRDIILKRCNKYFENNRKKVLERMKGYVENLDDYYIKCHLKKSGLPITPETIEIKRLQMQIRREIKTQNAPVIK